VLPGNQSRLEIAPLVAGECLGAQRFKLSRGVQGDMP
jgi:hypothetical protein